MMREYAEFGHMEQLSDILAKYQPRRILIITGNASYTRCGAAAVLEQLISTYPTSRFCAFEVNPKYQDVERGVAYAREQRAELVLAIGGGSVIDMAKMINCFSAQVGSPAQYITGEKPIMQSGKPLIAIPTTAGSGSEATQFAVVYIDQKKYSLDHPSLLPSYAILDARFTQNLPRPITASTGLDALSQAIESYWCVNSTEESKIYAKSALELALHNLPQAANNPTLASREAMLVAAHLAGKAINITKTTAPHALSYAFSSYFGVPHGHAVALTLGEMFVYNSLAAENDIADARGIDYLHKTMKELTVLLGCVNAFEARDRISHIVSTVGLPTRLSELGINTEGIAKIAKNVNAERLANNPRALSQDALLTLLHLIM